MDGWDALAPGLAERRITGRDPGLAAHDGPTDSAPVDAAQPLPISGNAGAHLPSKEHGDDRVLVERVRAGDGAAYAELVDRYGGRLHAMLLHLAGGDHDLAAEFTQEAFVRAYANLDQFAGASSFYTWIWRLARNRALDLLERKRARNVDLESLGAIAADAGPGAALEGSEQRDAVRRALDDLPADQREILLLREFDGLDYVDIATALDLPEGTVKSRLNRARAALRERLCGVIAPEDVV